MRDIRVVQAKTALRVTSVSPIRGFLPYSIIVMGEDFQLAEEVLYNGVPADEFVISSTTRLIVKIPDSQVGQPLNSVIVMSPSPTVDHDAVVTLEIPRLGREVSGMNRLVQDWVTIFLTTPGSDIFNPTYGGGARAIIGKPMTHDGKSAMAELSLAVNRTREQLVQIQSKLLRLPPSEKLMSASLTDIRYDDQTTAITAIVDLYNMAGETASLTLG
jgi:phage baseplate assembly protein W